MAFGRPLHANAETGYVSSVPRRSVRVEEDSWGKLLRDALIRLAGLGVLAGGVCWLAELPAAQQLPGVDRLPKPSHYALLAGLPTAAHVFGVKVPTPKPAHHRHAPRPTPVALRHARPVAAVPAAYTPPAPSTPKAPPKAPKPAPKAPPKAAPTSHGGVQYAIRRVAGVPLHVVTVDLRDPTVVGTLVFAKNAPQPNTAASTVGSEEFTAMAARTRAAVTINGTFFSKDAQKRVMGNMVRNGALVKFSRWDHDGTTFWLGAGNQPGMKTPSAEGPPPWDNAWLALSCGPRLVRDGEPWLQPAAEGFHDSHVLGVAGRTALGFDRAGHHLMLVSFDAGVSLPQEAQVMQALGCWQAMNLDGGASRSLALGSHVVVPAGRPLTNVLAFYDHHHPAPSALLGAFSKFHVR